MSTTQPWVTGSAFALTTALLNVACSLAVLFYPDAVLQVANSWVHGIDFTLIRRSPDSPLIMGGWAAGLLSSALFAFLLGAVYRWFANRICRLSTPRDAPLRASANT